MSVYLDYLCCHLVGQSCSLWSPWCWLMLKWIHYILAVCHVRIITPVITCESLNFGKLTLSSDSHCRQTLDLDTIYLKCFYYMVCHSSKDFFQIYASILMGELYGSSITPNTFYLLVKFNSSICTVPLITGTKSFYSATPLWEIKASNFMAQIFSLHLL